MDRSPSSFILSLIAGSYLIRESDRRPGSYVLSYLGKTGFNHFRITAMCGDYYIGGRQFASLSDLIGYYTSWSDLLKVYEGILRLITFRSDKIITANVGLTDGRTDQYIN